MDDTELESRAELVTFKRLSLLRPHDANVNTHAVVRWQVPAPDTWPTKARPAALTMLAAQGARDAAAAAHAEARWAVEAVGDTRDVPDDLRRAYVDAREAHRAAEAELMDATRAAVDATREHYAEWLNQSTPRAVELLEAVIAARQNYDRARRNAADALAVHHWLADQLPSGRSMFTRRRLDPPAASHATRCEVENLERYLDYDAKNIEHLIATLTEPTGRPAD